MKTLQIIASGILLISNFIPGDSYADEPKWNDDPKAYCESSGWYDHPGTVASKVEDLNNSLTLSRRIVEREKKLVKKLEVSFGTGPESLLFDFHTYFGVLAHVRALQIKNEDRIKCDLPDYLEITLPETRDVHYKTELISYNKMMGLRISLEGDSKIQAMVEGIYEEYPYLAAPEIQVLIEKEARAICGEFYGMGTKAIRGGLVALRDEFFVAIEKVMNMRIDIGNYLHKSHQYILEMHKGADDACDTVLCGDIRTSYSQSSSSEADKPSDRDRLWKSIFARNEVVLAYLSMINPDNAAGQMSDNEKKFACRLYKTYQDNLSRDEMIDWSLIASSLLPIGREVRLLSVTLKSKGTVLATKKMTKAALEASKSILGQMYVNMGKIAALSLSSIPLQLYVPTKEYFSCERIRNLSYTVSGVPSNLAGKYEECRNMFKSLFGISVVSIMVELGIPMAGAWATNIATKRVLNTTMFKALDELIEKTIEGTKDKVGKLAKYFRRRTDEEVSERADTGPGAGGKTVEQSSNTPPATQDTGDGSTDSRPRPEVQTSKILDGITASGERIRKRLQDVTDGNYREVLSELDGFTPKITTEMNKREKKKVVREVNSLIEEINSALNKPGLSAGTKNKILASFTKKVNEITDEQKFPNAIPGVDFKGALTRMNSAMGRTGGQGKRTLPGRATDSRREGGQGEREREREREKKKEEEKILKRIIFHPTARKEFDEFPPDVKTAFNGELKKMVGGTFTQRSGHTRGPLRGLKQLKKKSGRNYRLLYSDQVPNIIYIIKGYSKGEEAMPVKTLEEAVRARGRSYSGE